MRLDHIAYRCKNRDEAVKFFCDAFGYKPQDEFEITLEDGTKARCQSLEPPEKYFANAPFETIEAQAAGEYFLPPEIFVSDGPPGSLIDNWVNEWGRGIGGIHHMAYQVDSVRAKMKEWIDKGWLFTTDDALECEDLTQVFSKPNPFTGIIYEFIERRGQRGFCKDNVARLMDSTKDLNDKTT